MEESNLENFYSEVSFPNIFPSIWLCNEELEFFLREMQTASSLAASYTVNEHSIQM